MLIIILSILIGLFLSLITLPVGYYAPEWILLIVIYWAIAIPSNGKMVLAFISGIVVDIVYGQVLGISSLFYVLLIYLILRLYNSLRYMTIAQQAVVLFILIFIKQHLLVWAYYIIGSNIDYQALIVGAFVSSLVWPIIYFTLRFVRRKFNIGGTS